MDRYVPASAGQKELDRATADGLQDLIDVALEISNLKEFLGREKPTVITVCPLSSNKRNLSTDWMILSKPLLLNRPLNQIDMCLQCNINKFMNCLLSNEELKREVTLNHDRMMLSSVNLSISAPDLKNMVFSPFTRVSFLDKIYTVRLSQISVPLLHGVAYLDQGLSRLMNNIRSAQTPTACCPPWRVQ
jgi:hypothetical protein